MSWFSKNKVSKKEFDSLIESIKSSFSNVKTDISQIKNKHQSSEEGIEEIHNIIGYLNESLQALNNKIDSSARQGIRGTREISEPELEDTFRQRFSKGLEGGSLVSQKTQTQILDKLTSVQEEMLKRLAALNRENPNTPIAAKDLAAELYPETNYDKIRPMLSNYLDILEEMNLLKKIRKRRQVYAELTERGKSLIDTPVTKIKVSKTKKRSKG